MPMKQKKPMPIASATEKTANSKTGSVSVSYAAIQSCPNSCPFKSGGCYAKSGPLAIFWGRMNKAGDGHSITDIARTEARAIGKLTGKRAIRLHVAGDSITDRAARYVARAARRFPVAWTYTHAWETVKRKAWDTVSVLASCETIAQAKKAIARGYAPCIVVDKFKQDKAYMQDGLKIIPCPAQTRNRTCIECKLCFNDGMLRAQNAVIAFSAHGSGARKVREALLTIQSKGG